MIELTALFLMVGVWAILALVVLGCLCLWLGALSEAHKVTAARMAELENDNEVLAERLRHLESRTGIIDDDVYEESCNEDYER